jgi:hypothetical protein
LIVTALTHVAWFGLMSFFARFIGLRTEIPVRVSLGPQSHSAAGQSAHDNASPLAVDAGAER